MANEIDNVTDLDEGIRRIQELIASCLKGKGAEQVARAHEAMARAMVDRGAAQSILDSVDGVDGMFRELVEFSYIGTLVVAHRAMVQRAEAARMAEVDKSTGGVQTEQQRYGDDRTCADDGPES